MMIREEHDLKKYKQETQENEKKIEADNKHPKNSTSLIKEMETETIRY